MVGVMQSNRPLMKLGEVLTLSKVPVTINPLSLYKQVTVRLFHKGLMLREEKTGQEIQSNQWLVKKDQFLISRIDARNGAMGIVPSELDGAVVTNDFLRYDIDPDRLDVNFFDFLTSTEDFVCQCARASEGTTNRKRLRPDLFLDLEISIPPLEKQQRIVVKLKRLMADISQAHQQRMKAVDNAESLVIAVARHIFEEMKISPTPLNRWVDDSRDGIQTGPFGAQLGSSDFQDTGHALLTIGNVQYGGLRLRGLRFVSEEKAKQLERYTVTKGDIIFARMGTVGRCCVVPEEAQGWLFNYHIIRVAPDQKRINPRYLHWIIQASPDVEAYLDEKIRGATRQGVNTKIVSGLPCRVPPIAEQHRIVAHLDRLQAKVDEVKRLQEETERDMVALVPAVLAKAFSTRT